MIPRLFIVLIMLITSACSGQVMLEQSGYKHFIDYGHLTPFAAYEFSHSYDEDGKLVDTNLVSGKSLGEAGMNAALTAGAIAAGISALRAIDTGTNITIPVRSGQP